MAFINEIQLKTRSYADRVNAAIETELAKYSDSRFYEPLLYALEGGKRIRPLILLYSAEAVGCRDEGPIDAAVAVELLHSESIIHDDIIDQEPSRRDKAAFHVRYGYSASLLTADFVFAMILAIAARYNDRRVANGLSVAALKMCEGEYAELTIDPKIYKLGWDEYLTIISEKTAALFETSARLGAVIGGGSEREITALSNYGKSVGIAYQVRDDLLDWGRGDKIATGLLKNFEEKSVISQMKWLSESYAKKAKEYLGPLRESTAKSFLEGLTDFTISRNV
jgi:octaprenyl-diphosphate synthase